ncbi:hypothetical protein [Deinococcus yunweiensis]|uniref:hypothetical protein n=1 Tax=Deinococcus yunweiensis TaxID=367282 RepID=UPI00398EA1A0
MPDLIYDNTFNTKSRELAQLELALTPAIVAPATSLSYVFVPATSALGAFRRNPTVTRSDLFADENGKPVEAVTVKHKLGAQAFSVQGSPKNATIQAMILKGGPNPAGTYGNDVMARYTDAHGMEHQGQAILLFLGEAGTGPGDTTTYDFSLEWTRAGDPTFPT